MNGCTIYYQYDDKYISSVTSGEIVDVTNNSYVVHTPYNNLDKSIKFNSETMRGSSYNKNGDVKRLNIKGYRIWESPYEINIDFKKVDSRNSDCTYDIFIYGVVNVGYLNFNQGVTELNINGSSLKILFMKNNIEVESPHHIETNINKNNYLGENNVIDIGFKHPIQEFSINGTPYNDRIYSDLMPKS